MPTTYEPIATSTLASAVVSFTFSSIPATYTDLRLVIVPMKASGNLVPRIRLNGDTGSNYSYTNMWADGATAYSVAATNQDSIYLHYDTYPVGSSVGLGTADIFSYAGSTLKTVLTTQSSDKNGSGSLGRWVNLWRSTSAVTSITVFEDFGSFGIGTTATLYGIKNF
jgi:hypothetical protein